LATGNSFSLYSSPNGTDWNRIKSNESKHISKEIKKKNNIIQIFNYSFNSKLNYSIHSNFYFLRAPHIYFDLSLSMYGRLFMAFGINDIISYFFFLSNLTEIMINIERAIYFSEKFQKFTKLSFLYSSYFKRNSA
jgi:hypothetical protein